MMAKEHIIISQSILKELENDLYTLYKLIAEMETIMVDVKQSWGGVGLARCESISNKNWRLRKIKPQNSPGT